ncbi:MAG: energy transducer TonB [Chitinophagales bacterium]|nr:energy transducer TonB [Chitinophagales bacterium]
MQQTIFTLLLITILSINLRAQRSVKKYYNDQIGASEVFMGGDVHYINIQTAEKSFVKKVYYPEKKILTHYITYADRRFKERDGIYKEWYDDGRPWKEGLYKNGKKAGTWTYYPFDDLGQKRRGTYANGQKDGQWVWLDTLGQVVEERNYQNNELHGIAKIFDSEGRLVIMRTYEKGELISEKYFETDNPIDTIKMIQQMPMLKGCDEEDLKARKQCSDLKMLQNIYSQINYPRFARENGIEGTALFSFNIGKDGTLRDIISIRGLCADVEAECLRVIQLLPEWNPGVQNDEVVKVQFKLPVKFRLE